MKLPPGFIVVAVLAAHSAIAAPDFEREIRPLLREHCVECHGPKKQKGELRLDARAFAFKGGHDGAVIVPGDPGKSPLIDRIASTDADERMPPKGEPLSAEKVALLKAWIGSGAGWTETDEDRAATVDQRQRHWSVQPITVAADGPQTINGFVTAKLAEKGFTMSPEADRRTLIRRVSFDLLGLPPTPERVERFTRDEDPQAYEKLVDEFLASPHYGERWARHWLDIAHYADTHGFERDQLRPHAWRYRDYVIEALNADRPYDQFLREQIAGDVIAPDQQRAIVATGFLAAGPWDFVGHVETQSPALNRAARAGDLDDMVTQVMTSTMALTINCARCHDHKLDPISQKEYFSLWSVFAGVKRANREVEPGVAARLREEKERGKTELAVVTRRIAALAGEALDLADIVGGGDGRGSGTKGAGVVLETGEATTKKLMMLRNVLPNALRAPVFDAKQKTPKLIKGVFLPNGGERGDGTVRITAEIVLKEIPRTNGMSWDAVRYGTLNAQVHAKIAGVDYQADGHSIIGLHANGGITFDLAEIRKASGLGVLRFTAMVGFGATAAASESKADFAVYVDGARVVHRAGLQKNASLPVDVVLAADAAFLTLLATDGGDGIGSDLLFLGDARLRPEVQPEAHGEKERAELARLRLQRGELEKTIAAMPEPSQVYAVLSDAQPPVIRVQKRGNPEDEAEEVTPGAVSWARHSPATMGDQTTAEGLRRRALAEWITHRDNPLTRRVLVNRLWHHHFGQGIVTTPSDFGLGGDRPSHPELLDWLAEEFLRSGLSIKAMHRLIVNSAAYRQQSIARDPEATRVDAANRLLSRQNPRRLDAESLHDSVLAVAGTLNPAMGGPGYRDFKYTEAYAPIYEYLTPDKAELWRRSIYRFIVRTTPQQFMSTLDCPDPANLTPARAQTTTALQALSLSNNEFVLLQARHLATRIESETENRDAAIRRAFALSLQREPRASEVRGATELVAQQGLFALCRMLLNANEFIYLD